MSTDTLVSVIVITYNSAEYVVETLESIAKQSYPNIIDPQKWICLSEILQSLRQN